MKFIFILFFFFILLIFLMGFSILRTFRNMLFGSSKQAKKEQHAYRQATNNGNYSSDQNSNTYTHTDEDFNHSVNRRKIIGKDEGEYVDYEEVK